MNLCCFQTGIYIHMLHRQCQPCQAQPAPTSSTAYIPCCPGPCLVVRFKPNLHPPPSLIPFYQQSPDQARRTLWVSPKSSRPRWAPWPRARPTSRLLRPRRLISRGSTGSRMLVCASSTSTPSSSVSRPRPRVTMGKPASAPFLRILN